MKKIILVLASLFILVPAYADGDHRKHVTKHIHKHITKHVHRHITNNVTHVTEVTEVNSLDITAGVSDVDLARGMTISASTAAHKFDFATFDFQASVTGAFFDGEDSLSLGLAKRWEGLNALFHGSFTQGSGSESMVVVGGTFRF